MFHKSKFFYIFRQRSLNPTNEYHSFNLLLKEKKVIVFSNEQLFLMEEPQSMTGKQRLFTCGCRLF